jgi:flagellar motor switch protein FliN/FliY
MNDMSSAATAADVDRSNETVDQNFDFLSGVSLRVSVEVGSASLNLSEILSLSKGSVVELDRAADALLDIFVNGTLIARGEVVAIEGRYGIRVAEIVDRRMGGERRAAPRGIGASRAAA